MKTPEIKETDAQIAERKRAEGDNLRSMQSYLQGQTRHYAKMRRPRVSIATGRWSPGRGLI